MVFALVIIGIADERVALVVALVLVAIAVGKVSGFQKRHQKQSKSTGLQE